MARRIEVGWQVVMIGLVFWVFAAVIPLLGLLGVPTLVATYSSVDATSASHLTAAVLEPFVTKLFPALTVVSLATRPRESFPSVVQWGLDAFDFPTIDLGLVSRHSFVMGAYGGFTFGVLEALGKLMKFEFGITTGLVLALLLHVMTGLLIAGSVFTTVSSDREWVRGLIRGSGLGLALVLHVAWNTGLNAVVIRAVSM